MYLFGWDPKYGRPMFTFIAIDQNGTQNIFQCENIKNTYTLLGRGEGAGVQMKSSCLLQPHATPNPLYTEIHTSNFPQWQLNNRAAVSRDGHVVPCLSVHVGCSKTLLLIAQSDRNQQHTPWQSDKQYLGVG